MKIKRPYLLLFSPIYGLITWFRNKLFDWGFLKSKSFDIPVISVGNLNVGGTGKTPHVKYLAGQLITDNSVAVLSRGYGRETKGFQLASFPANCAIIGDEPAEIKTRYPELTVAVDEKRVHGIERLLNSYPNLDAIILDDAYQHRYVKPELSILLTSKNDLFANDVMLPGGNLREFSVGKSRADVVVVTKCEKDISKNEMTEVSKKLHLRKDQELFFSYLAYEKMVNKMGQEVECPKNFLLVTGIANPVYLLSHFKDSNANFEHLYFKDHHHFTTSNYRAMRELCNKHNLNTIVTTVKDFMRFNTSHSSIENFEIIQLPVTVKMIEREDEFQKIIQQSVSQVIA